MEVFQEHSEVDDIIDKLLIDHVRERPSLHYADTYSEADEKYWEEIQRSTGIQKSWLKKRWKSIRNEHQKIIIYNHIHQNKIPGHKMESHLDFLAADLNEANKMDFEDLKKPKSATFYVTDEMLENCDINESVTLDSIGIPIVFSNERVNDSDSESRSLPGKLIKFESPRTRSRFREEQVSAERTVENDATTTGTIIGSETCLPVVNVEERCEDTIFGELVVAMLKKMSPEQKKLAKKEIMNILL